VSSGAVLVGAPAGGAAERIVIGIGEYAIAGAGATIVTHALGSCVAVCLWDAQAKIGAMLHFLLPESRVNPERATRQPAAFADTGIPMLIAEAMRKGLRKKRCKAHLLGGAAVGTPGGLDVGRRNALAARRILWQQGIFIDSEALGGSEPRTVNFSIGDGQIQVSHGRDLSPGAAR
jgi:chemotaxis protein CheD